MNKDNAHSSSGKESLLKNTLYSWAGQLVFIISGFLLPRFISDFQGSDALGVWDFSWSIVNYLALSNLGIASSMNKYVAQYRAHSNFEGINRALSCVAFVQSIIGIFILSVSIVLYFVTPIFWADKLGNLTSDTQIVIFSLGSALALRTAFGALDGIITGFHRWDIYNILNSSTHAVTLVAMISSLLIANTLSALAIMYFLGALLNVVGKIIFSKRVFKQLHPSPRKIVKKRYGKYLHVSV
jgi:O-antigen/teichoic acid export membrane protein